MHWNHRVLRISDPLFGDSYAVHECFYTNPTDTLPVSWSEDPEPVVAETLEEIHETLKLMIKALTHPVLVDIGDKLLEVEDPHLPAEVTP